MSPVVFLRCLFFMLILLSFVFCMISLHFVNGFLFYFLAPSLFRLSMQWAEYLSSSLALLLAFWNCPGSILKVSFADERTKLKFTEYYKDRSKGEASSDIVICNHQLYTDWLYIWALLTHMGKGGNVKITLKKSLQWIPILGWGMKIVGFIFLSRKWTHDRHKFLRRISRLTFFKPFSFLIFPEGTTLCENSLKKSNEFAAKEGIKPTRHVMIPRTLGMYTSVLAVKENIEGIWDFTICYSDIPSYLVTGEYPEDVYGLKSLFGEQRAPRNIHFVLKFIPITELMLLTTNDTDFAKWLQQLYANKDKILIDGFKHKNYPEADFALPVIHLREVRNVVVAIAVVIAMLMLLIKVI